MKEFETKELNPMDKAVQMARAIQHFDKVVAIYKDQSTFENALETAKRELGVDANELDGFSGYAKCGYDDNNRAISFHCSFCGKAVVTDGKKDKRTRFCSETCEKKYWRHPPTGHSAMKTMPAKLCEWNDKNTGI